MQPADTWTQGLGSLSAKWSDMWVSEGKMGSKVCTQKADGIFSCYLTSFIKGWNKRKKKNSTPYYWPIIGQTGFSRMSFYNPGIIQGRTCLWLKSCWPWNFWTGSLPSSNMYYSPLWAMTSDKERTSIKNIPEECFDKHNLWLKWHS